MLYTVYIANYEPKLTKESNSNLGTEVYSQFTNSPPKCRSSTITMTFTKQTGTETPKNQTKDKEKQRCPK